MVWCSSAPPSRVFHVASRSLRSSVVRRCNSKFTAACEEPAFSSLRDALAPTRLYCDNLRSGSPQLMIDAEIKVTPQVAAEHGLSADEYARIQKILGREPNFTELGIFSVMWSEHCSYKSSRVHLKRLPTTGARVVQGPGENAGVVDIGDGLCAVFKIESHNHPSFVEPFQGAATGVGGILRDIFTMGARPIAVLDSLRFGPITPGPAAGNATA